MLHPPDDAESLEREARLRENLANGSLQKNESIKLRYFGQAERLLLESTNHSGPWFTRAVADILQLGYRGSVGVQQFVVVFCERLAKVAPRWCILTLPTLLQFLTEDSKLVQAALNSAASVYSLCIFWATVGKALVPDDVTAEELLDQLSDAAYKIFLSPVDNDTFDAALRVVERQIVDCSGQGLGGRVGLDTIPDQRGHQIDLSVLRRNARSRLADTCEVMKKWAAVAGAECERAGEVIRMLATVLEAHPHYFPLVMPSLEAVASPRSSVRENIQDLVSQLLAAPQCSEWYAVLHGLSERCGLAAVSLDATLCGAAFERARNKRTLLPGGQVAKRTKLSVEGRRPAHHAVSVVAMRKTPKEWAKKVVSSFQLLPSKPPYGGIMEKACKSADIRVDDVPENPLEGLAEVSGVRAPAGTVRLAAAPTTIEGVETLETRLFSEILGSFEFMEQCSSSDDVLGQFEEIAWKLVFRCLHPGLMPLTVEKQRELGVLAVKQCFAKLRSLERARVDGGGIDVKPTGDDAPLMQCGLIELLTAKFAIDVSNALQPEGGMLTDNELVSVLEGSSLEGGLAPRVEEASTDGSLKASIVNEWLNDPMNREFVFDDDDAQPRAAQPRGSAFTYGEMVQLVLDHFVAMENEPASPVEFQQFKTFLPELPWITRDVFAHLEQRCRNTSRKVRMLALLMLHIMIERMPACRQRGLKALFRLAYLEREFEQQRSDALQLILKRLYRANMDQLMIWQLPHLEESEAHEVAAAVVDVPEDVQLVPIEEIRGRWVEDLATCMLRSLCRPNAEFRDEVKPHPFIKEMVEELLTSTKDATKDRVWLYVGICIRRPVFLHGLSDVYGKCSKDFQELVVTTVEESMKHIPTSDPEILRLVQKCNKDTQELALGVLRILSSKWETTWSSSPASLPREFGDAALKLAAATGNYRLVVPVVPLLSAVDLLDVLPKILHLDPDVEASEDVRRTMRLLVTSPEKPIDIAGLLTELHLMPMSNSAVSPKLVIRALNIILELRDCFDGKVYGVVIQSASGFQRSRAEVRSGVLGSGNWWRTRDRCRRCSCAV